MLVIISLTGCSTWMRAFISMKLRLPSSSSRNSIVPGARVAHGQSAVDRALADVAPLLVGEVDGRRLLDQLLVATLHRAVALEEVDAVALAVADELHLGMTRGLEVALDVHGAVLEDRLGGRARGLVEAPEVLRLAHHVHPAAAAACHGLDDHGVADVGRRSPPPRPAS